MTAPRKDLSPAQAQALIKDLVPILKQLLSGATSIADVLNPFRKPGTAPSVPLTSPDADPRRRPWWVTAPISVEVLDTSSSELRGELHVADKHEYEYPPGNWNNTLVVLKREPRKNDGE